MKLVKSLLLGSAAGLVAVAGASAADLGVKKPTAVEYVRTCPTYGAGFFVVPGTNSCLKVGGRVRADYIFNNDLVRTADKNTFRARGYVILDHRTPTDFGLLRTFIRGRWDRDNAVNGTSLEYAFVQFGGFTFGRAKPLFEHYYGFNLLGSGAFGGFADVAFINTAMYTHNFGGGFSASLALDSANERRTALVGSGLPAGTTAAYGGQAMPDIVGQIAYVGSLFEANLTGAIHQVREAAFTTATGAPLGNHASTKYGWAIQGAAKVNLPFLAKGSNAWGSIAYADGASSYTGFGGAQVIGNFGFTPSDATIVGGPTNSLRTTKTFSVAGGVQLYFTPQIWGGLSGYYASHDAFGPSNTVTTYAVIGTVGWAPVSGFLIAGEVAWIGIDGRRLGAGAPLAVTGRPAGVTSGDRDQFVGRIRVQRDF